ncbi:MAG: ferritin [Ardenticatenaceae bacterium]|nr:ferritin [Ardenticatenaceae bacterium]
MISQTIQDGMNTQLKNELYSAYVYLSMAAYFEAANLQGFAHWMKVQSGEELEHAMKFYDFMNDRDGRVVLQAIDQPPVEYESPLEVFERALAHEQQVTEAIHQLYALAVQEQDYASQAFLQWFVTEQVEEEKKATQIIDTLKLVGDQGEALFLLDRDLAGREAGQ